MKSRDRPLLTKKGNHCNGFPKKAFDFFTFNLIII